MIYLISDIHNGESMRGLDAYLEKATRDDLLLVLGDVGLAFGEGEDVRAFTERFLSLGVRMALIDGNHENFAFLHSFPMDTFGGAPVRRLSESIVLLLRGNVYEIEGKSFFVMGGCKSSAKWKEMGLWYEGEEPTEEELLRAYDTLAARGNAVDYILTHKYIIEKEKREGCDRLSLEGLMNYIDERVAFRHWYSGHWHADFRIDTRHTVVYDVLRTLD